MDKHLHIVCLDVPYPVNYGGVFDLFYKITALYRQGIKIHLHCFDYGRGGQIELSKYCEEVFYYQRKQGLQGFSLRLPYIVNSRRNNKLLVNLSKDNYPVLLEGIHCTYFLYKNKLAGRKIFVRLHNVEFEYYRQLASAATSLFKKLYYLLESKLLKKYEEIISSKAIFITVALKDRDTYEEEFIASNVKFLPVFLPYTFVRSKKGKGGYCLYHGNLSVSENEKAANWLIKNVFNDLTVPLIIAGRNPSKKLKRLATKTNTQLVKNPSEQQMNELINNAQVNVLPSFNSTGIKLKLLNAIFNGRHCIVNGAAVISSGLENLCYIASDSNSFKENILQLYERSFTVEDIELRNSLLLKSYNNEMNARQLIQWIW